MVEGIDLWEAREEVDFDRIYQSGRLFCLLRCLTIDGSLDACYNKYVVECMATPMFYGNWHLFNPYKDPEQQLGAALNMRIGGQIPDAWDVERRGLLSRSKLTDRVAWLLESLGQEIGRRPLLYANYNYLENLFNDPGRLMRAADLWLGWPSSMQAPRTPKGYSPPLFWQYHWKGIVPGVDGPALLTRFMGTWEEFVDYVGDQYQNLHYLDLPERKQDELVIKALIQLGILDDGGFPLV